MVHLDDIKGFICSRLPIPSTTINLYNGRTFHYRGRNIKKNNNGKKEVFFYESNFDIMQQCAALIRLSKSSFQNSIISNDTLNTFILPYSRYLSVNDSNNRLGFRILHQHIDISDILHCDSEAFNYILHQSRLDLLQLMSNPDNIQKRYNWIISSYGLLLAALLKRLNLRSLKFESLLRLLNSPYNAFLTKNSKEIMQKCHEYVLKYRTSEECNFLFIKNVIEMTNMQNYSFSVSASVGEQSYDQVKLIVSNHDVCLNTESGFFYTINYKQFGQIKIGPACRSFRIILNNATSVEVTFLSDGYQELFSCLAIIDLYFRHHIKSRMLIEPIMNIPFDPYAMSYNELNPSQTSTNIYNIIEKSLLPLNFLSMTQGHKVLKDLGLKVGWYILLKPTTPHVYPMFIVLNAEANNEQKIHSIRILNKNGRFLVVERRRTGPTDNVGMVTGYRSLEELIDGIKICIRNRKIEPKQIVSEEMVIDIRKNIAESENDSHKQAHILSLHCLQLLPSSVTRKSLCTTYTGKWFDPNGKMKEVIAFLYDKKCMDKFSLNNIAKVAEISRPEFIHENILKCHGFADDGLNTIYYVHESFGFEISNTFVQGYSVEQLYEFGRQIKSALVFLHDRDIVHGFPALQNVYINTSLTQVKLGKIGILSTIIQGYSAGRPDGESAMNSFFKTAKFPGLNDFLAKWFSQRRIKILHEYLYPEEQLQETWDRYVFGCTLWQLFNDGAPPLPDKSDQELLDKLEGKDYSWFSGGAYFQLPQTNTEFLNKLQKIICVCVTWGNKTNQETYEFRKIAEAYEKLADVVKVDETNNADFILKAGNGKLDFDVNLTSKDGVINKYTLVKENDRQQRVVLLNNKLVGPDHTQLVQVKTMLAERDKLLQLMDLEGIDGGKFVVPQPGNAEVEAMCAKFTIDHNVWVKSFSKCKDVPENDFVEEVKHLLAFQHQNIVPLLGCVLLEETVLLVTPCYKYCKSLRDFIDNNNHKISEAQRASYALQVGAGMKYLASNKCLHRNLRLGHVYLTNYNNVVITNFGLARVTEALYYQQKRALNSDTFLIYPPEVISVMCGGGKVKFNTACDVWSYGVLLWELYSGEIAFSNVAMDVNGDHDINLLDQYLRAGNVLEAESSWPPNIRTIIQKCQNPEESRINFFEIYDILSNT